MPDPPLSSDEFFARLGIDPGVQRIIRRTAKEYEEHQRWITLEDLTYEAADDGDLSEADAMRLPSTLGGVWQHEDVSLTLLGLLESRQAPATCQALLTLIKLARDLKRRDRGDVELGREALIRDHGWSELDTQRVKPLGPGIPGLSNGFTGGDNWSFKVWRGVLTTYRDVDTLDDLRSVQQAAALEQTERFRAAMSTVTAQQEAGYGLFPVQSGLITESVRGDEDGPWLPGYIRVFISHLAEHGAYAEAVRDCLREMGVDAFVAHTSIEITEEWQDVIEKSLGSAHVLAGFLHEGFTESFWTQQEVGWALGRGIPVFLLRMGDEPRGFPGKVQWPKGDLDSPRVTASRILAWLCTLAPFGQVITDRIVHSLTTAQSADEAKEAAQRLEEIGQLPLIVLDAIVDAYESNGAIRSNDETRAVIERVLKKHGRALPTPHPSGDG